MFDLTGEVVSMAGAGAGVVVDLPVDASYMRFVSSVEATFADASELEAMVLVSSPVCSVVDESPLSAHQVPPPMSSMRIRNLPRRERRRRDM